MRPPELELVKPRRMSDLVELLRKADPETYWLAGGQALIKDLRQRRVQARCLVDLSGLRELDYVRKAGETLEIGALATLGCIAGDDVVRRTCPAVAEAAARVGDVQIRSRATIGGNLSMGAFSDVGVALVAAGAQIVLKGADGEHTVEAAAHMAMGPVQGNAGELITAIHIPAAPKGAFEKLCRRATDPAMVSAAVCIRSGDGERPAGIAIGGVHTHVVTVPDIEALLAGDPPSLDALRERLQALARELDPPDTPHAGPEYRRRVLPVVVDRAVTRALDAAGAGGRS